MTAHYDESGLDQLCNPRVFYYRPIDDEKKNGKRKRVGVYSPFSQRYLVLKKMMIPLGRDIRMLIGRDTTVSDLVLVDECVSKRHAMILYHEGCFFIQDLGSRNGTYVNGKRIDSMVELFVGDELFIEPYTMRFAVADEARVLNHACTDTFSSLDFDKGDTAGFLNAMDIVDVVKLFGSGDKSGLLNIQDGEGRCARLVFSKGQVVEADYDRKRGMEAIGALISRHEQEIRFAAANSTAVSSSSSQAGECLFSWQSVA